MATVTDVKGTKAFCDDVYTELTGMKRKLMELQNRIKTVGRENEVIDTFQRHLCELADEIDWKLQILAHACPYHWEGSADFEDTVQVSEVDRSPDSNEFSAGYIGG